MAGVIRITQEAYIADLVEKQSVVVSKPQKVAAHDSLFAPVAPTPEDEKVDESLKKKFESIIGVLWWLTSISRPDIYHAVHRCFKMQNKPNNILGTCLQKIVQ